MVWTIPNTFVAGTKARANEVNENFTSIKQFVDTLEVQASTNEIDITNLTSTKANTNGNNQERFQVANPTASYDAVNLQTLESKTLNSRSVIDGFTLSRFNDNTITAAAGNCYDSTYVYMISSTASIQESATLGANATYYVYVCADSDTSTCELVFNTSPTTPELPSGFDYFRRIGRFTTNSSSNIDQVLSEGAANFTNVVGLPDYAQASGRSAGTGYTASENGWVSVSYAINPNGSVTRNAYFQVNGKTICQASPWKYYDSIACFVPVSKGDTYGLYGDTGNITTLNYYFIPFKTLG